jgi:hypothetical protein
MINADTIRTTDSENGKSPATDSVVEEIKAGLKPVDQSSFPANEPEQGSEANEPNRESSLTRRALLKAGWAVPVILAVGLPSTVLAGATSPSSHHHDKPKGHFDIWPKKKHWPDFDKKKDSHHYDRLWW